MTDEKQKLELGKPINKLSGTTDTNRIQEEQYQKAAELLGSFIENNRDTIVKVFDFIIKAVLAIFDFIANVKKLFDAIHHEGRTKIKLKSGFWFIEEQKIISHLTLHKDINHEDYICEYYSADGWNKLSAIVQKWSECEPIQDRYAILKDCFNAVKLADGKDINIANAVIPTLINQIEGIQKEMKEDIIIELKNEIETKFSISLFPKDGKQVKNDETEQLKFRIAKYLYESHFVNFHEIINGLFKNSYEFVQEKEKGENITNLNRHKISHGEKISLDYGTKENLIRLFLCIDSIVKTIKNIDNTNKKVLGSV